jgi:hypothetical protein
MSKDQNDIITEEADATRIDLYDDEITDEDYGFVLGPDGELKSVFMPTNYFEIPPKVLAIFKAFGIEDPDSVQIHSVH